MVCGKRPFSPGCFRGKRQELQFFQKRRLCAHQTKVNLFSALCFLGQHLFGANAKFIDVNPES